MISIKSAGIDGAMVGWPSKLRGRTMRSSDDDNGRKQLLVLVGKAGADLLLQSEIDMAMECLIGGLPTVTTLRVAGILAAVLTPSWSEHRHFQEDVLFAILARAREHAAEFAELIGRLGDEHIEIGEHQREVSLGLKRLARDGRALSSSLRDLIEQTLALRRQHHAAENVFYKEMPSRLDAASREIIARWTAGQGAEPFPVNLIAKLWD